MSYREKQQKNSSDSIEDLRFHVLPPDRSPRQFITSVNPVALAAVPGGLPTTRPELHLLVPTLSFLTIREVSASLTVG